MELPNYTHSLVCNIFHMVVSYDYSDKWHYNSAGFIDLGVKFAEEMDRLMQQNKDK